jgi:hypothetical protein
MTTYKISALDGQLISDKEFSAIAQAAGVEAGCEKWFSLDVNYRQCEVCQCWGTGGEIVLRTDNGDLCESHLNHVF